MKQIWTGPLGRAAAKYGDNAPMAAVCCNACRTCVTTNIAGIVMAAAGGVTLTVAGFAKRLVKRDARQA